MTALLSMFTGGINWKWIGLGVAAVVLTVCVSVGIHAIRENGRLKGQVESAIDIANANAAQTIAARVEVERLQNIAVEAAVVKTTLRKTSDQVRRKIADAPAQDDGPIAPVLRRELDSLRDDPDGNQNGDVAGTERGKNVAGSH